MRKKKSRGSDRKSEPQLTRLNAVSKLTPPLKNCLQFDLINYWSAWALRSLPVLSCGLLVI